MRRTGKIIAALLVILFISVSLYAGILEPPDGVPGPTMHTLKQIYEKIDSAVTTPDKTDLEPPAGDPDSTMHTLEEIYHKLDDIVNKAFVQKTGQTTSYAPGDDGNLKSGVTWPNPRFTDNSDGTVTDNLTKLVWLKDANAFGTRDWSTALTDCNTLKTGAAGLTDGSAEGDWRLPSRFELESLLDLAFYSPALSNTSGTGQWTPGVPFTTVQSGTYWSGTSYAYNPSLGCSVSLSDGAVRNDSKTFTCYVWPVRDSNE